MFGKVKRWLGIEGVKLELDIPEEIPAGSEHIDGKIVFYSMNAQTVKSIRVVLIEKYFRGRRKNKLVDEYKLGEIEMHEEFDVPEHEKVEIDFSLPFVVAPSEMDALGDKNFVFRGLVKTAKLVKGVKSVYRVEAEADVKGTALNPFSTREIRIT
jgi:hypothetical protein